MDGREPFNGVLPPERFVALHARRWAEFGADEAHRTGFVVFEAALLQDPLVELMLFADWDGTQIGEAIRDLLSGVADLSPLVLRLVTADPAATVGAAAAERVDEHGNSWWHEGFLSFTADTPWARVRGLSREEAGLTFLRQRLALEDELRDRLPVTWVDVSSPAGGSGAWKELDEVLATIADRLVAGGTASTGGWPRGS